MIGQRNFSTTPPVVKNLLIINALFFLAVSVLPDYRGLIFDKLGLHFWASPSFQPYQLVTYMFLHGGLSHFVFNMFSLWMFGKVIESDLGSRRFLTYYMVTGVGAGIIQILVAWYRLTDPELTLMAASQIANTVTVGASGAGFGILLAFGMLHPNSVIMLLIPPIPIKAKYFVILYGILELTLGYSNYSGDNIAHFAHIGGMLWGYMLLRWWKAKGNIYY